jgi:hypothetical protein
MTHAAPPVQLAHGQLRALQPAGRGCALRTQHCVQVFARRALLLLLLLVSQAARQPVPVRARTRAPRRAAAAPHGCVRASFAKPKKHRHKSGGSLAGAARCLALCHAARHSSTRVPQLHR